MTRARRVAAIGVAVLAALPVSAATATASSQEQSDSVVIEVEMYEVTKDAAERFASLDPGTVNVEEFARRNRPAGSSDGSSGVSTQGSVTSNCGTAYLWINDDGVRQVEQKWGFNNLTRTAVAYNWAYSISGPNGWTHSDSGGGTLAWRRSWEGTANYNVPYSGYYSGTSTITAWVNSYEIGCIGQPTAINYIS